jgi:hypothetical protein
MQTQHSIYDTWTRSREQAREFTLGLNIFIHQPSTAKMNEQARIESVLIFYRPNTFLIVNWTQGWMDYVLRFQ